MFLNEAILKEIHERASWYDQENRFPYEDHEALKATGYYRAFVPVEYGGFGLTLIEIAHEQTRLAMAAPATALGMNMHHIVVGLGRYMVEQGNPAGEQILRDAAQGELMAFAISEPGNDRVLFGSNCNAKRLTGGAYLFSGHKSFISMVDACTRMVTYGQDKGRKKPKSVFAYLHKDRATMVVDHQWNTLGMRASQSQNLEFKKAFAAPNQILSVCEPGQVDDVIFAIYSNFEILLAATYFGIGKRALELGVKAVQKRKSASANITYDQDPYARWNLAEAAITLEAITLQIDKICDDFEGNIADKQMWLLRVSALKNSAVEGSIKAVDLIVRSCGGQAYSNKHELSRLFRDVHAGIYQPGDTKSLHELWAEMLLGGMEHGTSKVD